MSYLLSRQTSKLKTRYLCPKCGKKFENENRFVAKCPCGCVAGKERLTNKKS